MAPPFESNCSNMSDTFIPFDTSVIKVMAPFIPAQYCFCIRGFSYNDNDNDDDNDISLFRNTSYIYNI